MSTGKFFFLLSFCLWLASAPAAAGDCRAALRPLLLTSNPPDKDLASVRRLCEQAYEQGEVDAGYQLALLDLGLDGWQPQRAVGLIKAAAQGQVPEAQYWLAWQYEAGPLLENDGELALRWYLAAAAQEHRLALQRLADAYDKGELGLTADIRQATEYRARAERCAQQSG